LTAEFVGKSQDLSSGAGRIQADALPSKHYLSI